MIGMVWEGFDTDELRHEVVAIMDEIEADARQIIADCVNYALEEMNRVIEAAETKTGQARAEATGGHPGRVKTVSMATDVTFALENNLDGSVVGTWGWVRGYEPYYLMQEYGTMEKFDGSVPKEGSDPSGDGPGVPAMRALQTSYIKAREMMHERLREYGLEVS